MTSVLLVSKSFTVIWLALMLSCNWRWWTWWSIPKVFQHKLVLYFIGFCFWYLNIDFGIGHGCILIKNSNLWNKAWPFHIKCMWDMRDNILCMDALGICWIFRYQEHDDNGYDLVLDCLKMSNYLNRDPKKWIVDMQNIIDFSKFPLLKC